MSELGVLITNFCEPESDLASGDFLSSYFLNQQYVEGQVIGIENETDLISQFYEGPSFCEIEREELTQIILSNMNSVYSAFCSHYIISYANIIAPSDRTILNNSVKRQLFRENKDLLREKSETMKSPIFFDDEFNLYSGELILNATEYPYWNFVEAISKNNSKLSRHWTNYFNSSQSGSSRLDAIKYRDLVRNYYLGMDFASDKMKDSLPKIHALVKKIEHVFCDYPIPFLWLELAINQLGSPYHSQLNKHMRFSYKAKEKEMFVDSFIFDKCRSLYDWLPMIDLYGDELSKMEKQILVRICLDAIGGKQSGHILPSLYYGSNLIGQGEKDWAQFVYSLPRRVKLD